LFEGVEHLAHVVDDGLVGGEDADVGVDARGDAVVVAGGQVRVAADAAGFLAHD